MRGLDRRQRDLLGDILSKIIVYLTTVALANQVLAKEFDPDIEHRTQQGNADRAATIHNHGLKDVADQTQDLFAQGGVSA